MSIATAIIAAAMSFGRDSVLNWDHEVCGTPVDDLKQNLIEILARYTNWAGYRVDFQGNILVVDVEGVSQDASTGERVLREDMMLRYDLVTGQEYYGRLRNTGLTLMHRHELRQALGLRQ